MKRVKTLASALVAGGAIAGLAGLALAVTPPAEVTVEEGAIAESLTGQPGDPAKGREWFAGRKLGNCLACHKNSELEEQPFHGEVGPPLDGVADRWSEGELRAILVDAKQVFGDQTIMPSFYRDGGYNRPLEEFQGKTILEAQQVEDVLAYLLTLKE